MNSKIEPIHVSKFFVYFNLFCIFDNKHSTIHVSPLTTPLLV